MNVVEQMLARYQNTARTSRHDALREVMQEIALAGLNRAGFFEHAAFYGGTCLRIFHDLPRFSEDLDFSLLKPDPDFSIEHWIAPLRHEFRAFGFDIDVSEKAKSVDTAIASAFLKERSNIYQLKVAGSKTIKIKLEVDTDPPLGFSTQEELLLQPYSFYVKCFSLPDLFAGKMHALMYRKWQARVKGRDWFDFEWYVRAGHPMNLQHFVLRARQSGHLPAMGERLSSDGFLDLLKARIAELNIDAARRDVMPFVRQPEALDIWSQTYFMRLADKIRIIDE